jgi:hypothetical protein
MSSKVLISAWHTSNASERRLWRAQGHKLETYLPEIVALLVCLLEGATSSLPKEATAENLHISAPLATSAPDTLADVHVEDASEGEGQSDANIDGEHEAVEEDEADKQVRHGIPSGRHYSA